MLPLVEQLRGLVEGVSGDEVTETDTQIAQNAFISLKLLCRTIGATHRDPFLQVGTIMGLHSLYKGAVTLTITLT